jgi:hypothetical protein
VKQALQPAVPEGTLETYRSARSIEERLRQPKDDLTIVVLLPGTPEDFLDLLTISDLLSRIRTIIVLPDTKAETIAIAHRLRPRYLTYIDGNLSGLSTVVEKMAEGISQNGPKWMCQSARGA